MKKLTYVGKVGVVSRKLVWGAVSIYICIDRSCTI